MRKKIKYLVSEFLRFSSSDRNSLVVLCALILITTGLRYFIDRLEPGSKYSAKEMEAILEEWKDSAGIKNAERVEDILYHSSTNETGSKIIQGEKKWKRDPGKVELNQADSLQLVALRGVGPVFASRIIKYRELLGGFYSVRQLLEVYNFPKETYDQVSGLVDADTLLIKKIRINFAPFRELLRHPYLNLNEVKELLAHKNRYGAFNSLKDVLASGALSEETFKKIKWYITCR